MWSVTFVLMCITLTAVEGSILFRRKSTKCEAVVMCPQFCLKVKNGCYICECGDSMNSFMDEAVQQMKHDYDPIYQTGSRYLNVNMGASGTINGRKPNTVKSPWLNMGMGSFGANSFGGPMMGASSSTTEKGQYLEPDFKEFYRPVGIALPGRCPEMNYACPGQCWKIDGFSGCFRCDCEDTKSTARVTTPSSQTLTTVPSTEKMSSITSTTAPSTEKKITTIQPPATQARKHETSTVSSHATSSAVTSSSEISTSQSVNQKNIKMNQGQSSEQNGTNSALAYEGSRQNRTTSSNGQNGGTSSNSGGNVYQTNVSTNSSLDRSTESNLNGSGTPPSVKKLMDLTGVDLFRILIDGIKQHQSLQEVLYSLAHIGGKGHTEESMGDLGKKNGEGKEKGSKNGQKVNETQTSPKTANTVLTHPGTSFANFSSEIRTKTTIKVPIVNQSSGLHEIDNTEGETGHNNKEDCLGIGTSCPPKCHVIDPVSHCPVCGCSDQKLKSNEVDTKCAPLDVRCPGDCITLAENMCPVCSCTHRQTNKVTTNAVPAIITTKQTKTTLSSQMVCKVSEEIRNCATSCLKFDENFCPKCACNTNIIAEIGSDVPQRLPDKDNVCPAVERGCPQKCLKFDNNYCAYCFCDND